jgi:PTH2 family peptidyl-tRNA hydrolase
MRPNTLKLHEKINGMLLDEINDISNVNNEIKQVIVIRSDLKISRGKAVTQGSHAAVKCAFICYLLDKELFSKWWENGFVKITLRIPSELDLCNLHTMAKRKGLHCAIIQDAGLTQITTGTITALSILGKRNEIDEICGNLKLY